MNRVSPQIEGNRRLFWDQQCGSDPAFWNAHMRPHTPHRDIGGIFLEVEAAQDVTSRAGLVEKGHFHGLWGIGSEGRTRKESANEWIMFLDQENRDLKMRLMEAEKKLETVENALDEERLSILRAV